MFRELFGFEPPKEITEIKYKDAYHRGVMDGGWSRWMRFTYSQEAFSRILKTQGYKRREDNYYVALNSEAAPKWWPDIDQNKVTLYLRGHEDTSQSEGCSFREYLWHDTNSHLVYFLREYWD